MIQVVYQSARRFAQLVSLVMLLPAAAGPLQIVAPQDKRAARWVRQVTTIEIRQLQ